MIGFLRLMVFWSVFAAIAYWSLLVYSRSLRRESLEKKWDADPPDGATDDMRRAFIEQGMAAYEGSLRRKLLWGVIVLPFLAIGTLLYLVNYA
ncbi:MAG: hypothetical protein Q7J44_10595 [Pseudotabrizicola sp.]|uniref:hypothetical protein n=1 Tax=Pseudotabrizicola sp. TaxID=2939647 RepID=UPI00272188BB|nr:hypothetical protein [Pseudotabrizicola sp.]MDO9638980.1 hypothetical protein [Pseudotabrizicola sp.]